MLKADAYGHGLLACAGALLDQVDGVAVARLDQAEKLRLAYPSLPILLTASCLDHEALQWCQHQGVAIVLHEEAVWQLLSDMPVLPAIWLKLNTGMNRLGFSQARFIELAKLLCQRSELPVLMSHFSSADEADQAPTVQQLHQFDTVLKRLPNYPQSLANSAGVIAYPQAHRDWVRPGIMLYGSNPMQQGPALDLRPVMRLKARVLSVNSIGAGDAVGYGRQWIAQQSARIATVGIGYGDGYPRAERADLEVALSGRRVSVVGRVSMDMLAVDVSELAAVTVGDEVELWGDQIAVDEVAEKIGSISYDLLCRIQARVRHVYSQ